jgi:hypothetical protein
MITLPNYDSITNYPPAQKEYLRTLTKQGLGFYVELAIDFNTADAAVLATVPEGVEVLLNPYLCGWRVTTSFTGGASSAIGLSSSRAPHNVKGDILGAAAGDVAATLVSTGKLLQGTLGLDFASVGQVLLIAGDTIRFDRITSAFTAGAGFACLGGIWRAV